jgi:hypothetical protein
MALAALEAGVAKLRLNPGNITDPVKTREVVTAGQGDGHADSHRRQHGLARARSREEVRPHARSDGRSALRHVEILEELGHTDIVISLKAHDVRPRCTRTGCRQDAGERGTPYALHLGVTEAGLPREGTIKSSIGMGILLWEGIGDTLRVLARGRSDRRSAGLLGHPQGARHAREGLRHHGVPVVRSRRDRSRRPGPLGRSDRQGIHSAGQGRGDGLRRQWPGREQDGRRRRRRRQGRRRDLSERRVRRHGSRKRNCSTRCGRRSRK